MTLIVQKFGGTSVGDIDRIRGVAALVGATRACGHEVVVADPNYALMYGVQVRAVKTDRRDVAALAEACRLGISAN